MVGETSASPLLDMSLHTEQLQRYVQTGDPLAFRALVDEYQRMVHATCAQILSHCPGEIDDAVQETFVRLAANAGVIESNLGGWLQSCARTTALNRLRSARLRSRREAAVASERPVEVDDQQSLPDRQEELRLLDAEVDDLPEGERELVIAYFYLGHTQQQIADHLGFSQVAIQKRLKVVLARLRQRCIRRGVSVSALLAMIPAEHAAPLSAGFPSGLQALRGVPTTPPPVHVPGLASAPGVGAGAGGGLAIAGPASVAAALVLIGLFGLASLAMQEPAAAHASTTHGAATAASVPPAGAGSAAAAPLPSSPTTATVGRPGTVVAAGSGGDFPFRPQLGGPAWTVADLTTETVILHHAGNDLPAWHLRTGEQSLVGLVSIATPHLPDAYAVDFLLHTRAILCPFSSLWLEPCLTGRDPERRPLHELTHDVNPSFPVDSYRQVHCEVRISADHHLVEDIDVDGKLLRRETLSATPAALDRIALRVIDADCDVAQLSVTPLPPTQSAVPALP